MPAAAHADDLDLADRFSRLLDALQLPDDNPAVRNLAWSLEGVVDALARLGADERRRVLAAIPSLCVAELERAA